MITRDSVTLKVDAVITLYVVKPNDAAVRVVDYVNQTSQFAQTTLRSVLGEVELDELLSHRDKLNLRVQTIIDQRTERQWKLDCPRGLSADSFDVPGERATRNVSYGI